MSAVKDTAFTPFRVRPEVTRRPATFYSMVRNSPVVIASTSTRAPALQAVTCRARVPRGGGRGLAEPPEIQEVPPGVEFYALLINQAQRSNLSRESLTVLLEQGRKIVGGNDSQAFLPLRGQTPNCASTPSNREPAIVNGMRFSGRKEPKESICQPHAMYGAMKGDHSSWDGNPGPRVDDAPV